MKLKVDFQDSISRIDAILRELSPGGSLERTINEASIEGGTILVAGAQQAGIMKRKGNLFREIVQSYSYSLAPAYKIIIHDPSKLDQNLTTRKSEYNPREYISYWRFLEYGWGRRAGMRKEDYICAIIIRNLDSGRFERTSPFRKLGENERIVGRIFHPGRVAFSYIEKAEKDVVDHVVNKVISTVNSIIHRYLG